MFEEPTVFILGAGASKAYGYPTGEELIRDVIDKSEYISQKLNSFASNGVVLNSDFINSFFSKKNDGPVGIMKNVKKEASNEFGRLSKHLSHQNPLIIDDYMDDNPTFAKICKVVIAWVLIEYEYKHIEKYTDFFVRDDESYKTYSIENFIVFPSRKKDKPLSNEDWCRFVVYKMLNKASTFKCLEKNKITFVTFNYDVSLEYELYRRLANTEIMYKNEDVNPNKALEKDKLDSFTRDLESFIRDKVYHIHGSLRKDYLSTKCLDFFKAYNEDASHENFSRFIDECFRVSTNLNTISSQKGLEQTLKIQIQDKIKAASKIYILGFGFDKRNSDLIGLIEGISSKSTKSPLQVCYLNYEGQNKIDRKFLAMAQLSLDNTSVLLKDNFCRIPGFEYLRSTKDVYHALAEDFEL